MSVASGYMPSHPSTVGTVPSVAPQSLPVTPKSDLGDRFKELGEKWARRRRSPGPNPYGSWPGSTPSDSTSRADTYLPTPPATPPLPTSGIPTRPSSSQSSLNGTVVHDSTGNELHMGIAVEFDPVTEKSTLGVDLGKVCKMLDGNREGITVEFGPRSSQTQYRFSISLNKGKVQIDGERLLPGQQSTVGTDDFTPSYSSTATAAQTPMTAPAPSTSMSSLASGNQPAGTDTAASPVAATQARPQTILDMARSNPLAGMYGPPTSLPITGTINPNSTGKDTTLSDWCLRRGKGFKGFDEDRELLSETARWLKDRYVNGTNHMGGSLLSDDHARQIAAELCDMGDLSHLDQPSLKESLDHWVLQGVLGGKYNDQAIIRQGPPPMFSDMSPSRAAASLAYDGSKLSEWLQRAVGPAQTPWGLHPDQIRSLHEYAGLVDSYGTEMSRRHGATEDEEAYFSTQIGTWLLHAKSTGKITGRADSDVLHEADTIYAAALVNYRNLTEQERVNQRLLAHGAPIAIPPSTTGTTSSQYPSWAGTSGAQATSTLGSGSITPRPAMRRCVDGQYLGPPRTRLP